MNGSIVQKHRHQLQVASLLSGYAVAGFLWGAFFASTPDLKSMSGQDTEGFGLVLLAMTAGAFPTLVLLGRIMHRVQSWALPTSLVFFALGSFVLGIVNEIWGLIAGLVLLGMASGALDIALNMRISVIETETGKRLFNRAHAVFPLAMLIASPLTGIARDAGIGPALIFPFLGLLIAAVSVLEFSVASTTEFVEETTSPTSFRLSMFVVCLGAAAALGVFMEMSAQNWAAIYFETILSSSATVASLSIAGFTLGLSLGRLVAHLLESRLGDALVIRLGAVLGILTFLLIALTNSQLLTLIGFFLAGMAIGPIEPTVFRIVSGHYGPKERGKALSIVTATAYIGHLISPPILGAVAQSVGWPLMWTFVAFISCWVVVLTGILNRLQH